MSVLAALMILSAIGPSTAGPAADCRVAAGTNLEIATAQSLGSRWASPGDTFAIELVAALVVDGRALIPVHARGEGQVVHAARQQHGKTGELILAARYLVAAGTRVPLRGFRINAAGERTVTQNFIGGAVATIVDGTEVDVPAGTTAIAKVAADTDIPCP